METNCNGISALVLAFFALIILATNSTATAPGALDRSFGDGGIVNTGFLYLYVASDIAIQTDGKIIAVGEGNNGSNWDFAVVRYNKNGSLDASFGPGTGIVVTPIGASHDGAFSAAIQSDGKIVVAGYSYGSGFAVVRYNTNGSLDTSFNGTGIVTTIVASTFDAAFSVAIQPDGRIVVAGDASEHDFAVVRYNTDGSLDTSFNGTGIVITSTSNSWEWPSSVAIQADGKIVTAGWSYNDLTGSRFAVVRYTGSGQLDTSFNGTGIVTTSFGDAFAGAHALAIQPDGKIVAAGRSDRPPNADFAFLRYLPDGSLDPSFGGTGKVTTPVGNTDDSALSIAIQPDGKIVSAGFAEVHPTAPWEFAIVRINSDGSLDTTFNGTGKLITVTPLGNHASAVAIQEDGKIVAAGGDDQDIFGFTLARYHGAPVRTFADYDGDGRSDISVFRPADRTWYLDRSTAGFSAAQFGLSTDKITPADFDGDGKTDVAVYRPEGGTWYWLNSSTGAFNAAQFGASEDVPVPADYDGEGLADLTVFRPSNGVWYRLNSSNGAFHAVAFGSSEDKPTIGDFDGNGRADVAVFRPSSGTWYYSGDLVDPSHNFVSVPFGRATDLITPADFDGDGMTDIAVYRPSTGTWYSLNSSNGALVATPFGSAEDEPTAADYDGDGRADISVFRPSNGIWYRLNSGNGSFFAAQFGVTGDRPAPAAFRY